MMKKGQKWGIKVEQYISEGKNLEDGDELRSVSLSIAEKVAEGDKEVKRYVKAMEASNNYRDITKRLKMNLKQVGVVEERLYQMVKPYAMTAK